MTFCADCQWLAGAKFSRKFLDAHSTSNTGISPILRSHLQTILLLDAVKQVVEFSLRDSLMRIDLSPKDNSLPAIEVLAAFVLEAIRV